MDVAFGCQGQGRDRAEARRARIIEAARALFVSNGFHATGVAQIAKVSGVAVGQIYRDFDSKEEVVAAIVEGDCYAFLERDCLYRSIAANDERAVWTWLRQFFRPAAKRGTEPLFAEIIAESTRNERIAAIFVRKHEDVTATMLAALTLLAPGEHLADRRALLTELVLTLSRGLMQQRLFLPDRDTDQLVDAIVQIIAGEVEAMRAVAMEAVA
ncbi:TetR/AcrR family transcriptional regulator [uncultured Sphingomonas sp.]|uniref:TetR/AcrR family transcriptional regulator n=1 Tax=uncultured Sphingomonas sp. TaxID=158754 RepID=UPI0035C9D7E1